jgi:DNA-binding transcriptional LysR family regulator
MKLSQFRTIVEVSRQGLNLSKAAQTLHISQPALSKQILQLEDELGVTIFVRAGKRFVAITPPGQEVMAIAERIVTALEVGLGRSPATAMPLSPPPGAVGSAPPGKGLQASSGGE